MNIEIKTLEKYCDKLINKFYVLLPIFEGKDIYKQIVYTKEESYISFIKNLKRLNIEMTGCVDNYKDIVEFVEMYNIVRGLQTITMEDHDLLKNQVNNLIDICEKIKVNYND